MNSLSEREPPAGNLSADEEVLYYTLSVAAQQCCNRLNVLPSEYLATKAAEDRGRKAQGLPPLPS